MQRSRMGWLQDLPYAWGQFECPVTILVATPFDGLARPLSVGAPEWIPVETPPSKFGIELCAD